MNSKLVGLFLLCLFIFSACTNQTDYSEKSDSLKQAGGTAVIALQAEPDILNPLYYSSSYSGQLLSFMHDSLMEMNNELRYVPKIAESLDWAPDGMSVVVLLKKWCWEDGSLITATDVVESYNLYRNKNVASLRLNDAIRNIEKVAIVDDLTVKYCFLKQRADRISALGHFIISQEDREMILKSNRSHSILLHSSGQFVLDQWQHDKQLILASNFNYSSNKPLLDRVVFKVIPDESARVLSLQAGEVDIVDDIPPHVASALQEDLSIKLHSSPGRLIGMLTWNTENRIFKDKETRRALSFAIDRNRIINSFLNGYGSVGKGPIPPSFWAHNSTIEPDVYNPIKAKQLLLQAGWADSDGDGILERDGVELAFNIVTKKGDKTRENTMVLLSENFKAVGAKIECNTGELSTIVSQIRNGNFDSYLRVYSSRLSIDPSGLYASWAFDRANYGHFSSALIDSLLIDALSESNREVSKNKWHQFESALVAEAPAAFLYYPDNIVAVSKRIQNVQPHILSPYQNIDQWWIAVEDRKY